MSNGGIRIGVVAPGSRIEPVIAERVKEIAAKVYPDRTPDIHFHPQCFLSAGHFAGDDATRAAAFLEIANDPRYDAAWFAHGGYGSCRLAETILPKLSNAAGDKTYLGYSDTGSLLGALYCHGIGRLAHGPMPVDLRRKDGEKAVERALRFLVDRAPDTMEPSTAAAAKTAAFNITILGHLLGTPFQPDLSAHVLMLEEISEEIYRIDRALFHITSNPGIRRVAGIKLGRCSDIPPNDPDFGASEEDVTKHWCDVSGIPYLGRADIGHDAENKVVPFGSLQRG